MCASGKSETSEQMMENEINKPFYLPT